MKAKVKSQLKKKISIRIKTYRLMLYIQLEKQPIFSCESQIFTRFKHMFGWNTSRKEWKSPEKWCENHSRRWETQPCTIFWAFSNVKILKKHERWVFSRESPGFQLW